MPHVIMANQSLQDSLTKCLRGEQHLCTVIDNVLSRLNPNSAKINRALQLTEERLYSEALLEGLDEPKSLAKATKYNVTGMTKLRWMLDSDSPTFKKVDAGLAEIYRRRLLQYYHPDKATGDSYKFEMAKLAHASANIELMAMLLVGLGQELDDSDVAVYIGTVEQRIQKLEANVAYSILRDYIAKGPDVALDRLQKELDKRADLLLLGLTMPAPSSPTKQETEANEAQ